MSKKSTQKKRPVVARKVEPVVRILALWRDSEAELCYALEKWREPERFLFWKRDIGWVRVFTTGYKKKANAWAKHYGVKIQYPNTEVEHRPTGQERNP